MKSRNLLIIITAIMYILLFANTANAHNPMGVEAVSNYFGYSYIPGAILFILALVCSRILIKRRLRMKEMAIIFFAVFTSGYITLFFAPVCMYLIDWCVGRRRGQSILLRLYDNLQSDT